jgi:hypothetical protein
VDGVTKGGKNGIRADSPVSQGFQRLAAVSAQYQNGFASRPNPAFDVLRAVAHHHGTGQIDTVSGSGFEKHAGLGFSATAFFIGPVGTKADIRDMAACHFDILAQPIMNSLQGRSVDDASADGGLIRDHDDHPACPVQSGDRLITAFDRNELLEAFDVIGGIVVDHSIPIQKNAWL